jgi:hypothetical protein
MKIILMRVQNWEVAKPVAPANRVGTFSPRYCCASKHGSIDDSQCGPFHVTNLTPPGSECNPKHRAFTKAAARARKETEGWGGGVMGSGGGGKAAAYRRAAKAAINSPGKSPSGMWRY